MQAVVLPEGNPRRLLTGVVPAAASAVVAGILRGRAPGVSLVLVGGNAQAERWREDLAFHAARDPWPAGAPEVHVFPDLPEGGDDDPRRFDATCDRLAVCARLLELAAAAPAAPVVVLASVPACFGPVPPPERLARREIRVERGGRLPFAKLVERLGAELGYSNEAVCEQPGQYAVRGGLVDVYPVNASAPVRLDFFGDEVEDIRAFDPTTQRSLGDPLSSVTITPYDSGAEPGGPRHDLTSYLPRGREVAFVVHEPASLAAAHAEAFNTYERLAPTRPGLASLVAGRAPTPDPWFLLQEHGEAVPLAGPGAVAEDIASEDLRRLRGFGLDDLMGAERAATEAAGRVAFASQLLAWQRAGWRVEVTAPTEGELQRFREWVASEKAVRELAPACRVGPLLEGFRLDVSAPGGGSGKGLVLAPVPEVFGRYRVRPPGARRRALPQRAQVDQLLDFSELVDGDHLVHLQHGICIFRGVTRLEHRGRQEELLTLEFAEDVRLHLPLAEVHLLSRYVGLTKARPKLGKVGSGGFEKARLAAQRATMDFAAQLLAIQARRESEPGHACGPDTEWQREFEASFPHRETADQARAIREVKADQEKPRPMDRLVCGDVGFGKTEVALRAAFKAVQDGRQVAVLVPTTVLAQQHWQTFRDRCAAFPVVVERVSGFRSRTENARVLAQVASGKVDIVVGTHRLLSKDVAFRDLGLVVVDEEHRFGVRDKERLKALRGQVDVLTMSATPIPRTLYLALMGARDLSVIDTAPQDRLPIQTVVRSWSPEVVREAIAAELLRGGQAFYLHNRVETIEATADRIRALVPAARVGVGHGQMDDGELERVMTRFVAGELDVLVCTTIIESGLDIPNCNTILVEAADRFGLAQLYQIRGRVGRFRRQAYAYLLLHRHAALLDPARHRLSALRQHNQLGAGYRIAMRDLELRGAGNVLGAEQSGHIAGIGFDLYCQLLRQSIDSIKSGGTAKPRARCTLRLDFVVLGEATAPEADPSRGTAFADDGSDDVALPQSPAWIPPAYVGEMRLRIDAYRRLAMAAAPTEATAVLDGLADRFGRPPPEVELLVAVHALRCVAEQLGVVEVTTEGPVLKARRAGRGDDFVKVGTRFPRLTEKSAIRRVREIQSTLLRHARIHVSPSSKVPPPGGDPASSRGGPAG